MRLPSLLTFSPISGAGRCYDFTCPPPPHSRRYFDLLISSFPIFTKSLLFNEAKQQMHKEIQVAFTAKQCILCAPQ